MSKMKDVSLEYEQAAEYVANLPKEVIEFILSDPKAWMERINDYLYAQSMEGVKEE